MNSQLYIYTYKTYIVLAGVANWYITLIEES